MNMLSLFKRKPSMHSRQIARMTEWRQDRAATVAAMKAASFADSHFIPEEWSMVRDAESCMKEREIDARLDAIIAEDNRKAELLQRIKDSSRFTVLRMKRGLPFKSRCQP